LTAIAPGYSLSFVYWPAALLKNISLLEIADLRQRSLRPKPPAGSCPSALRLLRGGPLKEASSSSISFSLRRLPRRTEKPAHHLRPASSRSTVISTRLFGRAIPSFSNPKIPSAQWPLPRPLRTLARRSRCSAPRPGDPLSPGDLEALEANAPPANRRETGIVLTTDFQNHWHGVDAIGGRVRRSGWNSRVRHHFPFRVKITSIVRSFPRRDERVLPSLQQLDRRQHVFTSLASRRWRFPGPARRLDCGAPSTAKSSAFAS